MRKDAEFARQVQKEFFSQKGPKFQVVKLPCGHNVELFAPKDQYIKCPACSKQFLYVHSMLNKRLYEK